MLALETSGLFAIYEKLSNSRERNHKGSKAKFQVQEGSEIQIKQL